LPCEPNTYFLTGCKLTVGAKLGVSIHIWLISNNRNYSSNNYVPKPVFMMRQSWQSDYLMVHLMKADSAEEKSQPSVPHGTNFLCTTSIFPFLKLKVVHAKAYIGSSNTH